MWVTKLSVSPFFSGCGSYGDVSGSGSDGGRSVAIMRECWELIYTNRDKTMMWRQKVEVI